MAYKRILIMDILEIVRRYEAGQTTKTISEALGYHRKTVRKYIKHLLEKGISLRDNAPVDKEEVPGLLRQITTESERPADKQALLEPYLEELKKLVTVQSLKPKTAFNVLCGRHDLTGKVSYTSFKRFVRRRELVLNLID